MLLEFLGTGISQGIPVIGCNCGACTSTDPHDARLRTSAFLRGEQGTTLVFDIGPDFRYQMLRAGVERVDALLVTHEHSDHVAGLDDIRPFNWILRGPMPIYGHPRVLQALEQRCPYAFAPPEKRYPGAPSYDPHPWDLERSPEEIAVQIGEFRVVPLPVMHGPLPIVGYRVGPLAYITDCSSIPESTYSLLEGVRYLVLNALRPEPHPMHFCFSEALEVVERVQPQQAYLTHLSHEYGPIQTWQSSLPANVAFAYDRLRVAIERG